jgi:predicted nucleotidyltransferase
MGNIFYEDFRDFIQKLNDNNVKYLLVGGYSVIYHGYARTTGDMDIWVKREKENYELLTTAFNDFGMPLFDMTETNFLNHPTWDVYSYGTPPVCIDILVNIKGLEFDDCYANSEVFEDDGLQVRTINYNHLIIAKQSANRPKDIDDLTNLTT